ncbi:hypothetical protein GCM10010232_02820 [Streptomyces amakusaensis]|uniref:Uncharacterized protein n=1 Tax=Streptomyces amakusaensis TaxID=67271 RepID=A0ABW0AQ91_9ACTN
MNSTDQKTDFITQDDNHAPPPPLSGLLTGSPVRTQDNHAPAPKFLGEAVLKPLDNHAPPPPAGGGGSGPKKLTDSVAKPQDNHAPAPPRP